MQHILVFNSGSSSFKFSLFEAHKETPLLDGLAERLNTPEARMRMKSDSGQERKAEFPNGGHLLAIETLIAQLPEFGLCFEDVAVVGHRVTHGGETFTQSVLIDDDVISKVKALSQLAPLHNPANAAGIETIAKLCPALPQVAVFDTAFHQTLPHKAYLYPVPLSLYREHGVRRYGAHGTSHRYVAETAIAKLKLPSDDNNLLIAHLGNGCSATAVVNGCSVDTTMGLTPLEGLMMGTRSGDVDPSLHKFLQDTKGWSLDKITDVLNQESGLKGMSGLSNDMRTVQEAAENGHKEATIAIDVFCYRLARQLSALSASLNRLDAVVFTGGIGENNPYIRSRVLAQMAVFGFKVDETANNNQGRETNGIITVDGSPRVMVIKTNEEAMIARDSLQLLKSVKG